EDGEVPSAASFFICGVSVCSFIRGTPYSLTWLLNFTSPGSRLPTTGFDKPFEAPQITPHPCRDHADHVANLLHYAFWVVLYLQHNTRLVVIEAMKGHYPGVRCT